MDRAFEERLTVTGGLVLTLPAHKSTSPAGNSKLASVKYTQPGEVLTTITASEPPSERAYEN